MRELTIDGISYISGGKYPDLESGGGASIGGSGWSFAGAVLAIAAATFTIVTAPALPAVAAVLVVGAVGARAMDEFASGK